jgi:hypothetical protein
MDGLATFGFDHCRLKKGLVCAYPTKAGTLGSQFKPFKGVRFRNHML